MGQAARRIPTDPDAFVAWENRQSARYELIDGVVRMMSGGTLAHDLISANIIAELRARLRGSGCSVHGSNLKVRCGSGSVVYPAAFVRCGPADADATEIDDPVLVVEVESPKTKRYDMHDKRQAYQATASVRHVLFVSARACQIEVLTRQGDGDRWLSTLARPRRDAAAGRVRDRAAGGGGLRGDAGGGAALIRPARARPDRDRSSGPGSRLSPHGGARPSCARSPGWRRPCAGRPP
jgi:Uma2 family endonuclease